MNVILPYNCRALLCWLQGLITVVIPTGSAADRNSILNTAPSNALSMLYDTVAPKVELIMNAPYYSKNVTLRSDGNSLMSLAYFV
jgi:hypothetical protein